MRNRYRFFNCTIFSYGLSGSLLGMMAAWGVVAAIESDGASVSLAVKLGLVTLGSINGSFLGLAVGDGQDAAYRLNVLERDLELGNERSALRL